MKFGEWSRVVEELREALDRVWAELSRHEQTLASPLFSSDLADEHQINWQRALERFDEEFEDFQKLVGRADQQAADAEESLMKHEAMVRSMQDRLQRAHSALASAGQKF